MLFKTHLAEGSGIGISFEGQPLWSAYIRPDGLARIPVIEPLCFADTTAAAAWFTVCQHTAHGFTPVPTHMTDDTVIIAAATQAEAQAVFLHTWLAARLEPPFQLRRPCSACPFRTDHGPGFLTEQRALEIAQSLRMGESFICHKTLDYSSQDMDEDEEDGTRGPQVLRTSNHCAGATLALLRSGEANTLMQIGERLGFWHPALMDLAAPSVASLEAFVELHGGDGTLLQSGQR